MRDAPAMNCHDAREGVSAVGMGLTERALVHAHVLQCVECRKERESLQQAVSSRQRVEPSRAAWLTRLRVLLSISSTLSGQAAARVFAGTRVGVARVPDLLTRVRGLLSVLVKLSERTAANVIGATRFSLTVFGQAAGRVVEVARAGVARVIDLLTRVRWLLPVLFTPSVRAAANSIEAARAGVTRVLDSLTRLRVLLSISFTVSVRAAGRVMVASRAGAMRILDQLIRVRWLPPLLFALSERAAVKAMGATGAVGRIVVTSSSRARPLLKVCTGIVSLAVLIAAILALWPRQWPDNLMPRFSPGERLSRDVRLPVDRKPAELAVAAPLVKTSTPEPASAPQPASQTEIPAPVRRPSPSLVQSRATASAPMPSTEAAQNGEASDPTAAIDWLLQGGSSRRRIESP